MAEEHVERFSIDSAVRGFHVYKDLWNPEIGEVLLCEQEFGNLHDPYAVSVVREEMAADGIRSNKGPSGLGKTVAFFLKYFNNAIQQYPN